MIGIYKITNKMNGKCYIGQSINVEQRLKDHKNCKANKPLYRAFKKYGIKNFKFEVLEECSKEELNEKEIYYIAFYNSTTDGNGYNLEHGGEFKDIILCGYGDTSECSCWSNGIAESKSTKFIVIKKNDENYEYHYLEDEFYNYGITNALFVDKDKFISCFYNNDCIKIFQLK